MEIICVLILIHVPLSAIVVYDVLARSKRTYRLLWTLLIVAVPYFGARFYFQSMKRKKRPAHLKQIVDISLWGIREQKREKSSNRRKRDEPAFA